MSDERAGDKPLPLGHIYTPGAVNCRLCEEPRSAHEPPAEPKPADCTVFGKTWQCPVCNQNFPTSWELSGHMGTSKKCRIRPAAQPNAPAPEPPDRLREVADDVALGFLGKHAYERPHDVDECATCALAQDVHAALVRVVAEEREALRPRIAEAATRMYSAAAVLRAVLENVSDDRIGATRKLLIDSARDVDRLLLDMTVIRARGLEEL